MAEEEVEVDYEVDTPEKPARPTEDHTAGEDIYGDLYDEHGEAGALLKSKYAALEEKCRSLESTIDSLKQQLEEKTSESDSLQEEKRILVRNISCLYKTAKENIAILDNSINVKNEEILRLQLKVKGATGHQSSPAIAQHPSGSNSFHPPTQPSYQPSTFYQA